MITGQILRDAMISASNNLGNQRQRVDSLNVFPVPDGDTGTNMGMTIGAAAQELLGMEDSAGVYDVAHTVLRLCPPPGGQGQFRRHHLPPLPGLFQGP